MALRGDNWLRKLDGWLGPDIYSTAWVAMVPDSRNQDSPSWPEALEFIRANQLDDGGWGEPDMFYAHERTISTMAAIMALDAWQLQPGDRERVHAGLAALNAYASRLRDEPNEPIGFELILPRLRAELAPRFSDWLPLKEWAYVDGLSAEKLNIIQTMNPDPTVPQTWWFSMELLTEEQFAQLNDTILDENGSIATSTAATAAYLRTRRLRGTDSPRAAAYLDRLMHLGNGSVPVGWPFEVFERIWALDSFMRAELDPSDAGIRQVAEAVHESWEQNMLGLSYSDTFPVNDGDDTIVGFTVLRWAGLEPSDGPVLEFWDGDHFRAYLDERGDSPSVNIHALTALRSQPGFPNRALAEATGKWLMARRGFAVPFEDKWHYSPYYSAARAIPAFAGWDDEAASGCIEYLLRKQRRDGGWGWSGDSTPEETAHCVLGLYQAHVRGLLNSPASLGRAAEFFQKDATNHRPRRLWIGKTLYRPDGIVEATLFAAAKVLERLGYADAVEEFLEQPAVKSA